MKTLLFLFISAVLSSCCGNVKCDCANQELGIKLSESPVDGFSQAERDSIVVTRLNASTGLALDSFHTAGEFQIYETGYNYKITTKATDSIEILIKDISRGMREEDKKGCCNCRQVAVYTFLLNGNPVVLQNISSFAYTITRQ